MLKFSVVYEKKVRDAAILQLTECELSVLNCIFYFLNRSNSGNKKQQQWSNFLLPYMSDQILIRSKCSIHGDFFSLIRFNQWINCFWCFWIASLRYFFQFYKKSWVVVVCTVLCTVVSMWNVNVLKSDNQEIS